MKKSLLTVAAVWFAVMTWAVPADPALLKRLLESGDTARYEQMLRREAAAQRLQTAYPMVQRGQVASDRPVIRRAQAATQDVGNINLAPKGLLILAEYTDKQFKASNSAAQMDSMLNAVNYTQGKSIGSARKYFYDQSNGTYNPQFDVVGPVQLPNNMAYYGKNNRQNEDQRLGDLILHACSIASQIEGVDFADYDNDNDGLLDFVYVIYAGYGEADTYNMENTIWPCNWDIPSAIYNGQTSISSRNWLDTDLYTFDGKIVSSFACSSELSGNGNRAGIGTFCHEFSHVIGLPDYYDALYGSNYDNERTPGDWSLMDGGSYNEDGQVPPNYAAHDKWYVGWAEPQLLKYTQNNVSLPADGQTYYYVNASGTEGTATSTAKTYYIENRQQKGWDKGLPGHGMLVWRVEYNQTYWEYNEPNAGTGGDYSPEKNTSGKVCYTVVSAGTLGNPRTEGIGIGNSSDPFPGDQNKTTFAPFANDTITNISESAAGVITFDFVGETPTGLTQTQTQTQTQKVLINGSLYILKEGEWYDVMGRRVER